VVVSGSALLARVLPSRPLDCGRARFGATLAAAALAGALALHAVFTFLSVSLSRMRYPFELEWMEGGMLEHARRVLEGKALYPEPSPEFVPFIYGPLYSYASALAVAITGADLFALRLISCVSTIVALIFLYRIVEFETSSRTFGAIAPCLFVATFSASGGWFDLARVDSFALAWLLAAVDVTRRASRSRTLALAGVLLAGAVLTKQTCAIAIPALALAAFTSARLRGLLVFGTTCAAVGGIWGAYELVRSHGWFWYYTVELPLLHGTKGREYLFKDFWRAELVGALPIAAGIALLCVMLLPRLPRSGALAFHGSVGASLLLGSYASRVHMGSFLNDLMLAHAALSLLAPLGLFGLGVGTVGTTRLAWRTAASVAVAAQFAILAYEPRDHAVKRGSRSAGAALVERLRKEPGDVLVVNHSYLAVRAGKPGYAHQMAMVDVFGADADPRGAGNKLRRAFERLFEERRFSMVVLGGDDWYVLKPALDAHYVRGADVALRGEALMPVTGARIRPERVYVPRPKRDIQKVSSTP
jgi:hypothetical protein